MKEKIINFVVAFFVAFALTRPSAFAQIALRSSYVDRSTCENLNKDLSNYYNEQYLEKIFNIQMLLSLTNERLVGSIVTLDNKNMPYYLQIEVLKLARCNNKIDDVVFNLLLSQIRNENILTSSDQDLILSHELPLPTMQVSQYLEKKQGIFIKNNSSNLFPLSLFPIEISSYQKITQSERLYSVYSVEQIQKLAKILTKTFKEMESFRSTSSAAYKMAFKRLRREQKNFMNHENIMPTDLDIVSAAYEVGYLTSTDVSPWVESEKILLNKQFFLESIQEETPSLDPKMLVAILLFNSHKETHNKTERIIF